jgi:hypothetical protein
MFSIAGEGLRAGRDSGELVTGDYPGDHPHAFTGGTLGAREHPDGILRSAARARPAVRREARTWPRDRHPRFSPAPTAGGLARLSPARPGDSAAGRQPEGAADDPGRCGSGSAAGREPLRTPRAAAVAGIVFSVLLAAAFVLLRLSVPADPRVAGTWLTDPGRRTAVAIALNLVPFAGVAFLWFIGVLRDRIGEREDRFFATVFLGSGLLFVAMLFVAAAVAGGLFAAASRPSARRARTRWRWAAT